MKTYENISLKKYNSFGLDVKADKMVVVEHEDELPSVREIIVNEKHLILGGGSNILFTKDYEGTVIYNDIKGARVLRETPAGVFVEVMAGEVWHDFVEFTVNNSFYGLENLAYIPGKCGAAPVQNIGAYGTELGEFVIGIRGFDFLDNKFLTFRGDECKFGYRDSIFKNELKGRFFISSMIFKLDNDFVPRIEYKDLNEYFSGKNPSQKEVFDAVISIRKNKLPEPEELGNSGSFFKNPVLSKRQYREFVYKNPDIKGVETNDGKYKLSAARLIELAGWKGKNYKNSGAAVYDKHSLILVNKGYASGMDVFNLSEEIINDVKNKFFITLEREVNIV
jgi:UDP-N-acetylmuramate dehydrogenase